MGFDTWSTMPAAAHRCLSSTVACAVMATMGTAGEALLGADAGRGLVAVHLGHLDVHQDHVVGDGIPTASSISTA